MTAPFEATYLPEALPPVEGAWREEARGGVTVRAFYPTPGGIEALAAALRIRREEAQSIPVARRIEVFDRLAGQWLDPSNPERRALIPAIAAWTGFSEAMVAHALDLEQRSSRAHHLHRALRQELGAPEALDGFVRNPTLGGSSRAVGPGLVGAVCSANIPGLPHLEVMRALLVKAACLSKTPGGEPLFLAAYARSLRAAHPDLGRAVAVVALDRDDAAARQAFAGAVDHLTVYGGLDAVDAWRVAAARGPLPRGCTWHGHKLGASLILREALGGALAGTAEAVAYDFSLYDREACLSPAAVYVEGGPDEGRTLARAVASAMEAWAQRLPPGEGSLTTRAARRRWLDAQLISGAEIVAAPPGLPWVVTVDADPTFGPSAPGRVVRVVPVASPDAAVAAVAALSPWLQCVALAGPDARTLPLAARLSEAGASRITRPGLMGLPSMMWRHDGRPCLGDLVRFCDLEALAPEDNR